MARQDDSTATQQDQPPKEYKPETQAGSGILTFDEILGLTDVKFLEYHKDDSSDLSGLSDEELGVLDEWRARVDPEAIAEAKQEAKLQEEFAKMDAAKAARAPDATLDQIDQIDQLTGVVGYQKAQLNNLLKFDRNDADPGVNPLDALRIPVTDEPSVPQPCILETEDGGSVLYAGRFSSVHGEPGTGKSWVGLIASGESIRKGGRVLWMDQEERAKTLSERSKPLGLLEHVTREQYFGFYNSADLVEVEGTTAAALEWLRGATDPRYSLVVLDAAESWGCPSDGAPVQEWIKTFIEPWRTADIAVLLCDHVPKRPKDRPLGAIGSQRKRAAIDGAALRVIGQCWTKTKGGYITFICEKDRPGDMPGMGRAVGTIVGDYDSRGAFSWKLTAPATASGIEQQKVDSVLEAIQAAWPDGISGARKLQQASGMSTKDALEAVSELLRDGTVIRERHGRGFTYRASEEPGQEGKPDAWRTEPDEGDKQDSF